MDRISTSGMAQKYAKILQVEVQKRQGMLDLYLDMGRFQPSSVLSTDELKTNYFNLNYKKILFHFFQDTKAQAASYDDLFIQFANWLQTKTFPIQNVKPKQQKTPIKQQPKHQQQKVQQRPKQEQKVQKPQVKSTQQQRLGPPHITQTIQTNQPSKKTSSSQLQMQINPQKPAMTSQPPPKSQYNTQQEMRMKLQKQQKLMQQKLIIQKGNRQTVDKQTIDRQTIERLKEQADLKRKQVERANQVPNTQAQQQRQAYVPPPTTQNQLRPATNQLIVNAPNQGTSRGAGVSKSPTNARLQETQRVVYQRQEPKRQDIIKRILNRICDCYENPEKRSKPYSQVKAQIQNLKRLQQNQKPDKHHKTQRNDRR